MNIYLKHANPKPANKTQLLFLAHNKHQHQEHSTFDVLLLRSLVRFIFIIFNYDLGGNVASYGTGRAIWKIKGREKVEENEGGKNVTENLSSSLSPVWLHVFAA